MHLRGRNWHKSSSSPPAALTTLAACGTRFVRRPFVRSPLLVGGPAPLAGNLTLLFPAHRSKPSTFLACSVHGTLLVVQRVILSRGPPSGPREWSSRVSRYV